MFKTTLSRLTLALPALLIATQVSAHPGGHMEFNASTALSHMLASPYHTGIIVAGILTSIIAATIIIRKVSIANKPE